MKITIHMPDGTTSLIFVPKNAQVTVEIAHQEEPAIIEGVPHLGL